MAIYDLKANLDLKQNLNIYATCKQLDNLNLILSVYDNSVETNLSNYTVRLKAMKADKVPLIQEHTGISISSNIVTIVADEQLTITSGKTFIELQFIDNSTGKKKATFNLVLNVVSSTLEIDRSISKATYTLLEELENKLDQASDFFENIDTATNINNELKDTINTANSKNNTLTETINNANATNDTLNNLNTVATQTKNDLENQNSQAVTNKTNLDSANSQAVLNYEALQQLGDATELAIKVEQNTTQLNENVKEIENVKTDISNNYAKKTEVNELVSNKAEEIEVQALNTKVNSLYSGSPKAVSSLSQMTDTTKNYVLTTDGNWYYYNGSTWVSGGVYQSTGIGQEEVDEYKLKNSSRDFDISNSPINYNANNFVKLKWSANGLNHSTGIEQTKDYCIRSNLFSVTEDTIVIHDSNSVTPHAIFTYNESGSFESNTGYLAKDKQYTLKSGKQYRIEIGYSNGNKVTSDNDIYNLSQSLVLTQGKCCFIEDINNVKDEIEQINDSITAGNYEWSKMALRYGGNKFFNIDWELGGINLTTGLNADYNYCMRTKIFTPSKDILFKINSITTGKAICVFEYDSNGSMTNNTGYVNKPQTLKSGKNYRIVFGYSDETTITNVESHEQYVLLLEGSENFTFNNGYDYGKSIAIIGDSFTDAAFQTQYTKYYEYIKKILGIDTVLNYGQAGTCIAKKDSNTTNSFINRYSTVDKNADIVLVFGGTNDYGKNIPLGTLDSTDNTTFYGALKEIGEYLIDTFAGKPVIFSTPLMRVSPCDGRTTESYPANEQKNDLGLKLEDYVNAMIQVCNMYAIPICDLYHNSGLNPRNRTSTIYTTCFADGIHPNNKGYEIIGKKIGKFIQNKI